MEINLIPQQEDFLMSRSRFPCFVGGIGTGKTFMLLLKVTRFCQENPGAVAMIVRKEYTDLRDSTIIDFTKYFGISPNSARDVNLDNGSKIMFRHGGEIDQANLKNMTLDIVGVEQAEELADDAAFLHIRDRMRGKACPLVVDGVAVIDKFGKPDYFQQICLIANANGHDWVWKNWVNNPPSSDYHLVTATTFDNEKNLPASFVADQRAREKSEPSHFRRMVLNSFEEDISDDQVLSSVDVDEAMDWVLPEYPSDKRTLGVDVARYGEDETAYCVVERKGLMTWYVTHLETTKKKSLVETAGKVMEMCKDMCIDKVVIDDDGIGGGVSDILGKTQLDVVGYRAMKDYEHDFYVSRTTEAYFKVKEWIGKGWLKICKDEKLRDQLLSRRYKYANNGKRVIVSKDEMRKVGIKSPDRADALVMAVFFCDIWFQDAGEQSAGKPQTQMLGV